MSESETTTQTSTDAPGGPAPRAKPNAFGADVRIESDASRARLCTWTWPTEQLSEEAVPNLLRLIEGLGRPHPGRAHVVQGSVTAEQASICFTDPAYEALGEIAHDESISVQAVLEAACAFVETLADAATEEVPIGRWDPAFVRVDGEGGWFLTAPGLHALPMGARPLIVSLTEASACAPEAATGGIDLSSCSKEDRARAEAYALGATLYYVLSGKLPIEAETPDSYCRLQLETTPTPLLEAAPFLERHGTLHQLVDRCLERSALERPESLEELASALAVSLREAERLQNPGGFFPLRVSDSKGMDLPSPRPKGAEAEEETARHNRRQILVLVALVGLLLFLMYYQSHSPGLGIDETPPVIVPESP